MSTPCPLPAASPRSTRQNVWTLEVLSSGHEPSELLHDVLFKHPTHQDIAFSQRSHTDDTTLNNCILHILRIPDIVELFYDSVTVLTTHPRFLLCPLPDQRLPYFYRTSVYTVGGGAPLSLASPGGNNHIVAFLKFPVHRNTWQGAAVHTPWSPHEGRHTTTAGDGTLP
ncbi:hypothetical protein E2C01_013051 [Portunus trituberculatus]|uniref:Uncharacterized protein n=1 Tax=Portunus trituberculatus TaxID=210409 RepID=A0A5B7DG21_PORTR|nr:hypothetical protein [Portunus trituberculatus]